MRFFVSYSSKDSELADQITAILDRLSIPYFRDIKDIRLGDDIPDAVTAGVRGCTHALVLLSPASLKSHWVPFELGQAKARGVMILPYLQHPDLDVPGYIRNMLYVARLDELEKQLMSIKASPRPSLKVSREPRIYQGFMILEPYEDGQFTAPRSAHGWHELKMSLQCIGAGKESVFHVRPVRNNAFDRTGFPECERMYLRVGSPEPHGVVRGEPIPFPYDRSEVEIHTSIESPHGWDIGETKQFFATAGPDAAPSRFRSGPLTVKRVE